MRYKSILLAATGLLALAGATATVQGRDALLQRHRLHVDVAASEHALAVGDSIDERSMNPCKSKCYLQRLQCVKKCGGTDECKTKCECDLFSDPKQLCCVRKCVKKPVNCPSPKDVPAHSEEASAVAVPRGLPGFPTMTNQCPACLFGYDHCAKKCRRDDQACIDDCGCRFGTQYFCLGCSIPCASSKIAIETRDKILIGDFDTSIVGPVPTTFCLECSRALNGCRKKCSVPGACEDACNCYVHHSKKCGRCDIPCKCGDSCPRLSAAQRRFDARSSEHENVPALKAQSPAAQNIPPGNPCDLCKIGLLQCQNSCNNQPECMNYCSCMMKNVYATCKECKLSCKPTVETEDMKETALQLIQSSTTSNNEDVCDSCQAGVRLCQAQCNFDGACENACACIFANNAPQCRKCDISCNQVLHLQYGTLESQAEYPICSPMCMPVPVPPYCIPRYSCPLFPPPKKRENEIDTAVETAPNPCVVCRTGIKSCQSKCNGDTGCENQCSCSFKKRLLCKQCNISCDQ